MTCGRLAIVGWRAPDDVGLAADDGLQRGTVVVITVVITDDDDDRATVEDDVATVSNPADREHALGNITTVLGAFVDILTATCSDVANAPPVGATVQLVDDFPTRTDEPL